MSMVITTFAVPAEGDFKYHNSSFTLVEYAAEVSFVKEIPPYVTDTTDGKPAPPISVVPTSKMVSVPEPIVWLNERVVVAVDEVFAELAASNEMAASANDGTSVKEKRRMNNKNMALEFMW